MSVKVLIKTTGLKLAIISSLTLALVWLHITNYAPTNINMNVNRHTKINTGICTTISTHTNVNMPRITNRNKLHIRVSVLKVIQVQPLVPTAKTTLYIGTSKNNHTNINSMHKIKNGSANMHTHMYSYFCWSVDLYDICMHIP